MQLGFIRSGFFVKKNAFLQKCEQDQSNRHISVKLLWPPEVQLVIVKVMSVMLCFENINNVRKQSNLLEFWVQE